MKGKPTHFVIIDDDPFNNAICERVLNHIYKGADVVSFTDPEEGLKYVCNEYAKPGQPNSAILFLDLNMPKIDGWKFLDLIAAADKSVKERVKIYILSSSIAKQDIERAKANSNVAYYLVKPLTRESINVVLSM